MESTAVFIFALFLLVSPALGQLSLLEYISRVNEARKEAAESNFSPPISSDEESRREILQNLRVSDLKETSRMARKFLAVLKDPESTYEDVREHWMGMLDDLKKYMPKETV